MGELNRFSSPNPGSFITQSRVDDGYIYRAGGRSGICSRTAIVSAFHLSVHCVFIVVVVLFLLFDFAFFVSRIHCTTDTQKVKSKSVESGDSSEVERRTRDRKVSGSSPGRNGGRIFFSRVSILCSLISVSVPPLCYSVKDHGHSAKSADDRLQLNTHARYACGSE